MGTRNRYRQEKREIVISFGATKIKIPPKGGVFCTSFETVSRKIKIIINTIAGSSARRSILSGVRVSPPRLFSTRREEFREE